MSPTTVLVTGGAGFIGSTFVRRLLTREPAVRVVTLDALTYAGLRENLDGLPAPERHRLVEGDVRDQALVERLLREEGVDAVVHFAAETHVDRSIRGPRPFVEANVVGTFALLEAARTVWLGEQGRGPEAVRFHHVSTDEVYGALAPEAPAFRETTPYDPSSPYSASKAAADHFVRAYHRTFGLPVTITNCSNNYGPRQYPEKLIPVMLLSALAGRPLPLYGDGLQVRDWLYVEDHAEAVWRVVREGRVGETYNVGGRCEVTNLDLVRRLCAALDRLVPDSPYAPHAGLITFVEDRPGHDRRYAMDVSKIERELGWTPSETLESGLEKTARWYLANEAWLETVAREKGLEEWWETHYAGRSSP